MSPLFAEACVTALLLGARHALDADHLVAVSTILSRTGSLRRAAAVGLLWGAGHTLTLLVAGVAAFLFRLSLPPVVSQHLEAPVGVMLVVLGLLTLREHRRRGVHLHVHRHGAEEHVHFHTHGRSAGEGSPFAGAADGHVDPPAPAARRGANSGEHAHAHQERPGLRPLLVGMVHGLAGSAAMVLLASAAMPSAAGSLAFTAVFGAGSMAGMAAVSAGVALPLSWGGRRLPWLGRASALAAGTASALLGALILAETLSAG